MGGWGSGRGQHGRNTTSDMQGLDIRQIQHDGLLTPGQCLFWPWSLNGDGPTFIQIRAEPDRVILNYRNRNDDGEWLPMECTVYLEWTDCNLGGKRSWFLCPVPGCGRRVAILHGGSFFACRHCHKLAYASQREADEDRAARRADNIRLRLGWPVGILNSVGGKPKGMHWHTFWRLKAEHDAFVGIFLAGIARRLDLIESRLTGIESQLKRDG